MYILVILHVECFFVMVSVMIFRDSCTGAWKCLWHSQWQMPQSWLHLQGFQKHRLEAYCIFLLIQVVARHLGPLQAASIWVYLHTSSKPESDGLGSLSAAFIRWGNRYEQPTPTGTGTVSHQNFLSDLSEQRDCLNKTVLAKFHLKLR